MAKINDNDILNVVLQSDVSALISASIDLLDFASGRKLNRSLLARNALRHYLSVSVERNAARLIKQRLALMTEDERAILETKLRAEYQRRLDRFREVEQVSKQSMEQ